MAEGLTQPELAVIAAAAGSAVLPNESIPVDSLKNDIERAGFTSFAFSLSIRRLLVKNFIKLSQNENYNGEPYDVLSLTDSAWTWIESNESKFLIRKEMKKESLVSLRSPAPAKKSISKIDDDLEF